MSIALFQAESTDSEHARDPLDHALRLFTLPAVERTCGHVVLPGELRQQLLLDPEDSTRFRVSLPRTGRYWMFVQHRPESFDLRLVGPILLDQRRFSAARPGRRSARTS